MSFDDNMRYVILITQYVLLSVMYEDVEHYFLDQVRQATLGKTTEYQIFIYFEA